MKAMRLPSMEVPVRSLFKVKQVSSDESCALYRAILLQPLGTLNDPSGLYPKGKEVILRIPKGYESILVPYEQMEKDEFKNVPGAVAARRNRGRTVWLVHQFGEPSDHGFELQCALQHKNLIRLCGVYQLRAQAGTWSDAATSGTPTDMTTLFVQESFPLSMAPIPSPIRTMSDLLHVAGELAGVVLYLHSQSIVHGAVRPAHVMQVAGDRLIVLSNIWGGMDVFDPTSVVDRSRMIRLLREEEANNANGPRYAPPMEEGEEDPERRTEPPKTTMILKTTRSQTKHLPFYAPEMFVAEQPCFGGTSVVPTAGEEVDAYGIGATLYCLATGEREPVYFTAEQRRMRDPRGLMFPHDVDPIIRSMVRSLLNPNPCDRMKVSELRRLVDREKRDANCKPTVLRWTLSQPTNEFSCCRVGRRAPWQRPQSAALLSSAESPSFTSASTVEIAEEEGEEERSDCSSLSAGLSPTLSSWIPSPPTARPPAARPATAFRRAKARGALAAVPPLPPPSSLDPPFSTSSLLLSSLSIRCRVVTFQATKFVVLAMVVLAAMKLLRRWQEARLRRKRVLNRRHKGEKRTHQSRLEDG